MENNQEKPTVSSPTCTALLCGYDVRIITRADCADYVLNIHYAKRWPSISYAFGLYLDESGDETNCSNPVEAVVRCNKNYCKEPSSNHKVFLEHLLQGGEVYRDDPLNNVKEILTKDILTSRDGCVCRIQKYGYKNLSVVYT